MAGFQNAIDKHRPDPFVSSEVEPPVGVAPSLTGISTSLDANGDEGLGKTKGSGLDTP